MEIEFQNENLVATSGGKILAMVPDIITVMDRDTADTITTEKLKYGQRIKVIAAAAPDMLRDDRALSFVGPRALGMAFDYEQVESLIETETAWEERRAGLSAGKGGGMNGWVRTGLLQWVG